MAEAVPRGPLWHGGAAPARNIWIKVKRRGAGRRPGWRAALAGLLLGLAAGPAAADDCIRLGHGFDFCPAGSDWAAAEWESAGDVTDVILGDVFFWFTGAWGGRAKPAEGQPLPPAATELEALLAWSHGGVDDGEHTVLTRDAFVTGDLQVERSIARLVLPEPPPSPLLRATMIVSAPAGARMMLALQGAESVGAAVIDRRSREIVALLRPRPEN